MEHLKELRIQKGVLQKDVANYLNIGRTTYVKYENKDSEPNEESIVKLAKYFNVTTDYLLGHDTIIPSKKLTEHEEKIIDAYRARPEMQAAVDRLLGIEQEEKVLLWEAAQSENHHGPGYIEKNKDQWKKIKESPNTDDPLL